MIRDIQRLPFGNRLLLSAQAWIGSIINIGIMDWLL